MTDLPVLRVPVWECDASVVHGFLGRAGGTSVGHFATLNLSARVGDDPAAVAENQRRVRAVVPPEAEIVPMHQVHGARVATVSSAHEVVGQADGLVTGTRGLVLSVLTADCVPVLIKAPGRAAVMAVHAGWRGTLAGIVVQAMEAMRRHFDVVPGDVEAALGPAIGGCCYEVDCEIGREFSRRWGDVPGDAWQERGAKGMLDLRAANAYLLKRAGVNPTNIHVVGPCTRCEAERYFSHRASGGRTGRQLSYIGLAV